MTTNRHYATLASQLCADSRTNHSWRRNDCINLIPSEQVVSPLVERLCTSDPAGRYNEHRRIGTAGRGAQDVRYYKGTAFIMEKELELQLALCTFFNCTRAETRVISGQMANDTVYDALKQFRNRGNPAPRDLGPVLVHHLKNGGHLSAQPLGALKNYIAIDPHTGRPAVVHFPAARANPYCIDVEQTKQLIAQLRPELVVFGRSVIVHTEPVAEIARFIHAEFGKDSPDRPVILYDGAHVLGLLGDAFQQPLAEGADLLTGSTHKTFFGPQRGVILSNIEEGSPFEDLWNLIEQRTFPGHVSNHHLGTMLGLLGATYEMLAFKSDYPDQVIANAKAFAGALNAQGLNIEGDIDCEFTETHQVLLRTERGNGELVSDLLESNNIITNPQAYHDDDSFTRASGVRMGTQEMTRYGMKEADFEAFAGLFAQIVHAGDDKPRGHFMELVKAFRARFRQLEYSL
jgi:aminomethyltransferase